MNYAPSSGHTLLKESMEARIEQAARGDRQAMGEIVAEHYPAVYRFCARRVGEELALDAAQETFLTAMRTLSRFNGSSTLLTYLLGIALNHCRNLARKHRMTIAFDDLWQTAAPSPEQGLLDGEALKAALAALTAEQREIVVMHEIEGLTYDEIASLMCIPAGTVKSRLHYAFVALRMRMMPGGEAAS